MKPNQLRRIGSIVLSLALVTPAWASKANDSTSTADIQGADPDELASFRKTHVRFVDRMREMDRDTRDYVDLRESEERGKLVGSYDALISSMEEDEKAQRMLAVERFERFLERYPAAEYSSHVRFRLADLLFEEATEEWYAAFEAYENVMNDPDASLEELEAMEEKGAPLRDLGRPVELYERIIADNKDLPESEQYEGLDSTYVMLGFVYNDQNAEQYLPERARLAFADLILHVPSSDLVDRSHLFLGNFMFADGDFDDAMAEYELVVNKGAEGKYYMEALYQLAWAKYKLDDFDGALTLFKQLLDRSEGEYVDTGKESPYGPDAKRFMAFSIADVSYDSGSAVKTADEYFAKTGDVPYKRDVYVELSDVLIRYTRPEEAIEVFERLQGADWANESDNPEHQIQVVTLYSQPLIRDLESAGNERLAFIERYSEGTSWWEANRNDPEALEIARGYIESSLLDVAIEYRVRAQETNVPGDYAVAASKYQEYLDAFPISDDYYEQQWALADSLKRAEDFPGAQREYTSLIRSSRYHPFGDGSRYALMDVALLQVDGGFDEVSANAKVIGQVDGKDGPIDVFELSPQRQAFIAAADGVLEHDFAEPTDASQQDYREVMKEKGPPVLYLTAQMYHYHNQLEEARVRFQRLIDDHNESIQANYAAGLLVEGYIAEGNLEKVRFYTKKFTQNPPGPPTEIDPDKFKGTLEGTTFMIANELASDGSFQSAADAFIAFRDEFPSSEYAADALFNAAFYNQKAGKASRSSELYEQFVRTYPDDPRSKDLLSRIAGNYEQAFELEKAVDTYRDFLQHPAATEQEKADAQFNASFLLIGLGRHREAAEGFESYERDYDTEDQEDVYWLAGEQWEVVDSDKALGFYQSYLRKYPDTSPDHVIEAYDRMARIHDQRGDDRAADRERGKALDAFDRFARSGQPIRANGHKVAAAAEFPTLQVQFDDLVDEALTGNEDKDGKLLQETKPKEIKAFEAKAKQFVSKFADFEYSSAALLLQARAPLYLADLGLSIECPDGFSEEECWAYDDLLQEKVFPQYYEVEEVGISRLQELVNAARDQKRHSSYIDEALVELNKRRPADFPAAKDEIEGGTDSNAPLEITPVRTEKEQ